MIELTFVFKPSYGQERFYPACVKSAELCTLAERKCLSLRQLDGLVRVLGYEITIQNESGVGLYVLEQTAEEIWVSHG